MSADKKGKQNLVVHFGGCHCGKVRFQVNAPAFLQCVECSCSICQKKQNVHFIVPSSDFQLFKGKDDLTCYTFNTHKAQHLFCKTCGVQSFYKPRSNPDGIGIMPHCLDKGTVLGIKMLAFDGDNWEKSMEDKGEVLKEMSRKQP